jgi:hypothetical protein
MAPPSICRAEMTRCTRQLLLANIVQGIGLADALPPSDFNKYISTRHGALRFASTSIWYRCLRRLISPRNTLPSRMMVKIALSWVLAPLALATFVSSTPATNSSNEFTKSTIDLSFPANILCKLPIVKTVLCPDKRFSLVAISTPIGAAVGVGSDNAYRFVVKYGNAARWMPSTAATKWTLP